MSNITLSSLSYITRDELAALLQKATSQPLPDSLAIIDVRDSDHIGGHIRGSTWVPSSTLEYRTAELVRTLREKELVVFHCVLSQQRGPGAALGYLREKARLDAAGDGKEGVEGAKKVEGQKVVVLRGGFNKWQEKYGSDERLTEGWEKDIWEYGGY